MCRDFLGWLDRVEECRTPTRLEKWVKVVIKRRFAELANMEEDVWKQRAKARWELHGDRNTKFFHMVASSKKRSSSICELQVDDGITNNPNDIAKAF